MLQDSFLAGGDVNLSYVAERVNDNQTLVSFTVKFNADAGTVDDAFVDISSVVRSVSLSLGGISASPTDIASPSFISTGKLFCMCSSS